VEFDTADAMDCVFIINCCLLFSEGVVVSRSCWEPLNEDPYKPNECNDMFSGRVCYCTTDNCNGAQLVRSNLIVYFFALLPLMYTLFRL